MKRFSVLGGIVLAGSLAAAVAHLAAQQQPQVVGSIQKVTGNVYWMPGAGGTTAVYVAEKGVVLVDTKLANNGQGILDQVKTVTNKPITHIINTHVHADHMGSNSFFPAAVEVVAHENTAVNATKLPIFQDSAARVGLPDTTFKDRQTVLSGNDAIDLYYFGPAHTNGDALVVFRSSAVMHAGDILPNKAQPFIDAANGGTGVGYPDTMAKAIAGIKNVKTVISGHFPSLLTWQDFVDYQEFNRLLVDHGRQAMKAGQTPEQAMNDFRTKLPAKFKDYNLMPGRGGPGGNFIALFEELKQRQ